MLESKNKTLNAVYEAALQLSAEERENSSALLNEQSAAEDLDANRNAACIWSSYVVAWSSCGLEK